MFRIPPRRNVLKPIEPLESVGAMVVNAERGSSRRDVFGSPIVRPSTDGSIMFGRSPLVPSTLPEPGPSDPEITVKGSPVFARKTPDKRQFLTNRFFDGIS